MSTLSLRYLHFGYRRVQALMARLGFQMGQGLAWQSWNITP